jgi:hypothetical protein
MYLITNSQPNDSWSIKFNQIAFSDWSKMFIMPKHVFYDLFYITLMFNMIKEII